MEDEQHRLSPPVLSEPVENLKTSLESTIHILQGILDDINRGVYDRGKAEQDYENLMFSDGIDFMSCILGVVEAE